MVKDIFGKFANSKTGADSTPDETLFPTSSEPAAVVVMIADFEGATGHDLTARISQTLKSWQGVDVRLAPKRLKTQSDSTFIDKLAEASTLGRTWLAQERADVLVWGEMSGTEGAAFVRFLPAAIDADGKTGTFGLGDALELPTNHSSEYADIISAAAISAAVTVKQADDTAFGSVIAGAVGRISGFVEAPPPGLSPTQAISLMTCLGNCFASLGRANGEDEHLERAIRIYKLALGACPQRELPIPFALIQNHLAAAFEAMGGRETGSEYLEQAAKAYHAVAVSLSFADHPKDWAFAQTRLGMVFYRLAVRRDNDAAHLKASIKALETARTVFTQDDAPDRWAEITNQIGVALMALGSQVAGTEALERSIKAFRSAHEVRFRTKVPLLWAQTANNLGAASIALFRRSKSPALLEEAVRNFEGAREVFLQHRQNRTVAVIEKNLTRARELMGRRR